MSKTSSTQHFVKIEPGRGEGTDTFWTPNTDVYVTDKGLVIKIELAGMRREDLQLMVEGNRVKISGNRPDGCRAANCKFLVMEINYGAFESSIELPPGYNMKSATASYQNGFLRIDVPRSPELDGAAFPSLS